MKNVGTVEVLTENGVRAFPYEEEVHLVASVTRVRMATAAALPACTLTGNVLEADAVGAIGAIDTSVTPAVGDLILVKNQVAGLQNGVYEFLSVGGTTSNWKLRRAIGWDVSSRVKGGKLVSVSEGTANGNSMFMLTTNDPIVLNTTALVFGTALAAAPGAGSITHAMLDGDCVDGDNVADDAIDSEHVADHAIDPPHLANDAFGVYLEVDHGDTSPVSVMAAVAGQDRVVQIHAVCSESLGGDTPATFSLGVAGTVELFATADAMNAIGTAGDKALFSGVLAGGAAMICTVTAGSGGAPAGKFKLYVTAAPIS